jgi:hypothetical protein
MCQNITLDPRDSNWRRCIGHLIERSPNSKAIQDAAHKCLGSWSATFQFMWRITHDELHSDPVNWPMKCFDSICLDTPLHAEGIHINVLEFLACVINLWLALWATRNLGPPTGGWILLLRTDNTSAPSWLQH